MPYYYLYRMWPLLPLKLCTLDTVVFQPKYAKRFTLTQANFSNITFVLQSRFIMQCY